MIQHFRRLSGSPPVQFASGLTRPIGPNFRADFFQADVESSDDEGSEPDLPSVQYSPCPPRGPRCSLPEDFFHAKPKRREKRHYDFWYPSHCQPYQTEPHPIEDPMGSWNASCWVKQEHQIATDPDLQSEIPRTEEVDSKRFQCPADQWIGSIPPIYGFFQLSTELDHMIHCSQDPLSCPFYIEWRNLWGRIAWATAIYPSILTDITSPFRRRLIAKDPFAGDIVDEARIPDNDALSQFHVDTRSMRETPPLSAQPGDVVNNIVAPIPTTSITHAMADWEAVSQEKLVDFGTVGVNDRPTIVGVAGQIVEGDSRTPRLEDGQGSAIQRTDLDRPQNSTPNTVVPATDLRESPNPTHDSGKVRTIRDGLVDASVSEAVGKSQLQSGDTVTSKKASRKKRKTKTGKGSAADLKAIAAAEVLRQEYFKEDQLRIETAAKRKAARSGLSSVRESAVTTDDAMEDPREAKVPEASAVLDLDQSAVGDETATVEQDGISEHGVSFEQPENQEHFVEPRQEIIPTEGTGPEKTVSPEKVAEEVLEQVTVDREQHVPQSAVIEESTGNEQLTVIAEPTVIGPTVPKEPTVPTEVAVIADLEAAEEMKDAEELKAAEGREAAKRRKAAEKRRAARQRKAAKRRIAEEQNLAEERKAAGESSASSVPGVLTPPEDPTASEQTTLLSTAVEQPAATEQASATEAALESGLSIVPPASGYLLTPEQAAQIPLDLSHADAPPQSDDKAHQGLSASVKSPELVGTSDRPQPTKDTLEEKATSKDGVVPSKSSVSEVQTPDHTVAIAEPVEEVNLSEISGCVEETSAAGNGQSADSIHHRAVAEDWVFVEGPPEAKTAGNLDTSHAVDVSEGQPAAESPKRITPGFPIPANDEAAHEGDVESPTEHDDTDATHNAERIIQEQVTDFERSTSQEFTPRSTSSDKGDGNIQEAVESYWYASPLAELKFVENVHIAVESPEKASNTATDPVAGTSRPCSNGSSVDCKSLEDVEAIEDPMLVADDKVPEEDSMIVKAISVTSAEDPEGATAAPETIDNTDTSEFGFRTDETFKHQNHDLRRNPESSASDRNAVGSTREDIMTEAMKKSLEIHTGNSSVEEDRAHGPSSINGDTVDGSTREDITVEGPENLLGIYSANFAVEGDRMDNTSAHKTKRDANGSAHDVDVELHSYMLSQGGQSDGLHVSPTPPPPGQTLGVREEQSEQMELHGEDAESEQSGQQSRVHGSPKPRVEQALEPDVTVDSPRRWWGAIGRGGLKGTGRRGR
ncbi:hypothetical protein M011DRAFT_126207 [Sporormia fimetaria CBS 119925]|uniref:Uncharacterized protein n=1 Tax=Sporormia fimetaria CBS 119925 TaxID=1340428 RepID=A0A6A6V5I3_9PLEO|nr:hypothetical protein M011DRAFT_126207 [Sporormia fimetaria CBS 119925]